LREWLVPSPKLVPLVLSDAGRASLEALSRKRTASQSLAEQARAVLAFAEESGAASLTRAARKITDEQVEALVTRTLTERGPGQDSHWSTRSRAAETGLSQSSVSRI
jgi:hypothetical protein